MTENRQIILEKINQLAEEAKLLGEAEISACLYGVVGHGYVNQEILEKFTFVIQCCVERLLAQIDPTNTSSRE